MIGIITAANPFYSPRIALGTVLAACLAVTAIILSISERPAGRKGAVFLAGLFLALPVFVRASPMSRCLLLGLMAVPFTLASAWVLAPKAGGFRARVAYLCAWCGRREVQRQPCQFDVPAGGELLIAGAVFAASLALVKSAPAHGCWLPIRWLCGGILFLAFAQIVTAAQHFTAALAGIVMPFWFQSPYRSTSVAEFWARRWNIAASEILRNCCFLPLAHYGAAFAVVVTFLASGVGHALLAFMALEKWSLSLLGGTFFVVQPLLIAAERGMNVRQWRPAAARTWTLAALAITSPLFVEPALQAVSTSWGAQDEVLRPTVAVLGAVLAFSGFVSVVTRLSAPETGSAADRIVR